MGVLTLNAVFRRYCQDCRSPHRDTGCLCVYYPGRQYSLYTVEEWIWRMNAGADVVLWWDPRTGTWIGPRAVLANPNMAG